MVQLKKNYIMLSLLLLVGAACHTNQNSSPEGQQVQQATSEESSATKGEESSGASKAPTSFESAPPAGTRAHCPVMQKDFLVTESSLRSEHNGKHFAFCCPSCKPRFDANPNEFIEL